MFDGSIDGSIDVDVLARRILVQLWKLKTIRTICDAWPTRLICRRLNKQIVVGGGVVVFVGVNCVGSTHGGTVVNIIIVKRHISLILFLKHAACITILRLS